MNNREATERFQEADALYRRGAFQDALYILDELDEAFPNRHRVLFPKARCLAHLGQVDEALAICDRLIDEFDYEKAAAFKQKLLRSQHEASFAMPMGGTPDLPEFGSDPEDDETGGLHVISAEPKKRRIKPIRLLLLFAILGAMYMQWIPYWLGGGVILGYFILKWALGRAFYKMLQAPFAMKGKALAGAHAEVHSVEPAPPADYTPEDEDEEDGPPPQLDWFWIETTITPQQQGQNFTHWEPGELMVCDFNQRVKTMDDLDQACQVADIYIVENGETTEWDGSKYATPVRIRIRVGCKPTWSRCKFAYYTQSFGDFSLPNR